MPRKVKESQAAFWEVSQAKGETVRLTLFSNIQFIYELALARLELNALGVKFRISNGLREFRAFDVRHKEILKRRPAYFSKVDGHYSDYYFISGKNRTRSVNQYLTHWIYPYKGKFHPQMMRALLNIMGLQPGETVLDPFIGSGTTALEAVLLGINCIGLDVSPLCVMQSKVKVDSVSALNEIREARDGALQIFKEHGIRQQKFFEIINGIENASVRDFYRMVYLVSVSDAARRKRDLTTSFHRNLELMLGSVEDFSEVVAQLALDLGKADLKEADCRELPLSDNSVDGIITSPPYSIALDYISNDAHAFKALGYDLQQLREKFIGVRGQGTMKVALYNQDMAQSIKEISRVLKPGKFCSLVIGDASLGGQRIPTVDFTIKQCQGQGMRLIRNIPKIIFGLYNVMLTENILIFQKV